MTRRILSIDGGGVRGVIPAVTLAALEKETGGLARDQFDFVAGTSTGALIAAAVAVGIPAQTLVELYVDRAPKLFRKIPLISTLQRILFGHMYDTDELHRLIRRELGSPAADWRLNDVPRDILITAKGLTDGHQWYFVKDHQRNARRTGKLNLADCLTASAAAPTFFAPRAVAGIDGLLVDGGTGVAGNPVYQACVEAFNFTDAYPEPDTIVVSIGTGQFLKRPRPTWLYSWLGWLLAELLRSPGEQQTELVDRHFPKATFYRIDLELPRDYSVDDATKMADLKLLGQKLSEKIDWPKILDGTDQHWLVRKGHRRPPEYAEPV
ncbi:MAG TPA: patatin-like phospholipase family protein [Candidatus Dormibacteraeota bacterium]|nr:patatin-like phospholipase family protein [Candidatus Dormibacteraeota bacterium]